MMLMANLMDGSKTQEERIEFWDILKGELDREKLLIDDILTAGKMEGQQPHLHYKMINMLNLFNDLFTKLEIQAKEKNIHLEHSITRDEGVQSDSIMSDEVSINQIFGNLIGNALKFTPSGGSIKVKIHFSSENMVFTIQDTGIGIPAEDVPFLFSRFFRGTNAIEKQIQGTGIGLFIVKSLLDRIGGTIQLNTRVGKGTKFTVTLPRAL
jgi:signal transduction histidine kinase